MVTGLVTAVSALAIGSNAIAVADQPPTAERAPSEATETVAKEVVSTSNAADFWTKERMRRAVPAPMPRPSGGQVSGPEGQENVLPQQSERGSLPRGVSTPQSSTDLRANAVSRAQRWTESGIPASTTGKMFAEGPQGQLYRCSGSVITADNQNTVWTAGHCLHDGNGQFYSNITFVPAYDNGTAPHGEWNASYMVTTTGWAENRDWEYDIAAFAVFPQSSDLEYRVGSQGYRFNAGQEFTDVRVFGYPAAGYQRTDFNGELLWYCRGDTVDASSWNPLNEKVRTDCDMHSGASGGPWIDDMNSNGLGYVIGASSHRQTDPDTGDLINNYFFSSNHGDAAINVYEDASTY
ncbi:trypsin-like serine peptidase [Actinopolyspora lacussalsi]